METIFKQPSEKIPVGVDFRDIPIPSGESIQVASTITIMKISDSSDVTATLLVSGSTTITGTQLKGIIQAGSSGVDYKITFKAVTQNYIFEEDVKLSVREV